MCKHIIGIAKSSVINLIQNFPAATYTVPQNQIRVTDKPANMKNAFL